jgi:hypothetical protein
VGSHKTLEKEAKEGESIEIKFMAARRIGELVPKEMGGRGKKTIRTSNSFPTPPRLTEFRKLAKKFGFGKRIETSISPPRLTNNNRGKPNRRSKIRTPNIAPLAEKGCRREKRSIDMEPFGGFRRLTEEMLKELRIAREMLSKHGREGGEGNWWTCAINPG